MHVQDVSSLGRLWIRLLWTLLHMSLGGHVGEFLLSIHIRVALLGHQVYICLIDDEMPTVFQRDCTKSTPAAYENCHCLLYAIVSLVSFSYYIALS